jgi:hypothetical protein
VISRVDGTPGAVIQHERSRERGGDGPKGVWRFGVTVRVSPTSEKRACYRMVAHLCCSRQGVCWAYDRGCSSQFGWGKPSGERSSDGGCESAMMSNP